MKQNLKEVYNLWELILYKQQKKQLPFWINISALELDMQGTFRFYKVTSQKTELNYRSFS
ncbi:hypothetical protein [Flavobacterium sp. GT3P67]|uniref:hypothetical protein n=1 Tax=Flavobacterium sp. GT3P67 TaxID=2541722 RepID=UPI001044C395|nr:hypothetical protein [Flavobacterium sp. GT3P67]TDE54320.1 hypothetical protein E0H99_05620 [Flavobacterium sp. GT3P67]